MLEHIHYKNMKINDFIVKWTSKNLYYRAMDPEREWEHEQKRKYMIMIIQMLFLSIELYETAFFKMHYYLSKGRIPSCFNFIVFLHSHFSGINDVILLQSFSIDSTTYSHFEYQYIFFSINTQILGCTGVLFKGIFNHFQFGFRFGNQNLLF